MAVCYIRRIRELRWNMFCEEPVAVRAVEKGRRRPGSMPRGVINHIQAPFSLIASKESYILFAKSSCMFAQTERPGPTTAEV